MAGNGKGRGLQNKNLTVKLQTKLVIFATLSTLVIALLFVLLLPYVVQYLANKNTNQALVTQKQKVLKEIAGHGIQYYLQGEEMYGGYSMLKDEYISLQPFEHDVPDNIITEDRIVEGDTINYRILTQVLPANNKKYLLEIGRKISTIDEDSVALQKMALYVLLGLVLLTLLSYIVYTSYILKPLGKIIKTKIVDNAFPFVHYDAPVKTSTYDFRYLDNTISRLMMKVNEVLKKEKEFTSNASHELMTPISIMQSKIENIIADENLPDKHVAKMEDMLRTLGRLKKIVNSLMLIARVENEQYVRKDTLYINALLQEVIDELEHRLHEKNLQLTLQLQQSIQLKKLNRELLFQLFYNIINNAIRYNYDMGSIVITDEYIPGKTYTIYIKDTGIGMEQNEVATIFDRFKKSSAAPQDSNGLGLAIVHSIAQYQNIQITATSVSGHGSSFAVIFSKEHL